MSEAGEIQADDYSTAVLPVKPLMRRPKGVVLSIGGSVWTGVF